MGAGLQNIVVDREEDAKSAIAFLKQREGGRATFLPLTAIRGEELRERGVENEFGFVGVASRLVRFDPKYTQIFNSLLGRTVIAEDLDCGIAMARKYRNAFRIVTLDGQVINRGGSMTGGSTSRSAGVLSRAGGTGTAEWPGIGDAAGSWRRPGRQRKPPAGSWTRLSTSWTTAETQRRAAEDEVLRLQGVRNQFDMLLAHSAGERGEPRRRDGEPIGRPYQDNEARYAGGQSRSWQTRKAQAASCRGPGGGAASPGRSELLAPVRRSCPRPSAAQKARPGCPGADREASAAPCRRICGRWQRSCPVTGSQKEAALAQYQRQH